MDLQDITKQESGIVFFPNSLDMIICNWSGFDGIPRLDPMGYRPLGLEEKLFVVSQLQLPCISTYFEQYDGQINLVYDHNNDIEILHGTSCTLYELRDEDGHIYIVVAPDDWN